MSLTLTAINRFPVKSCRGEALDSAEVQAWGLDGDRRWMLVDETGETVTARECPGLLQVHPRLRFDGGLDVSAGGASELSVPLPVGAELTPVSVFGRAPFLASVATSAAHAWFSQVAGTAVRLVYADDPARRLANPVFAGPGVPMSFADGYPVHVTTAESLASLNELIAGGPMAEQGPVPMIRFRPNLVVSGGSPWEEDGWRALRVGNAHFRAVKGCDRCVIPTTDPQTAHRAKEPTATLARHRRFDGAVWFGMDLVPSTPGTRVRVGDHVEILHAVDAPDGPPR